jgi:hypothetical protein
LGVSLIFDNEVLQCFTPLFVIFDTKTVLTLFRFGSTFGHMNSITSILLSTYTQVSTTVLKLQIQSSYWMQKYSFFFREAPHVCHFFYLLRIDFVKYCFFFEPSSGYEPHLTKKIEISGWSVRFYRILIWQIVFCKICFFVWFVGGSSRLVGAVHTIFFLSYFKSRLVIQKLLFSQLQQ